MVIFLHSMNVNRLNDDEHLAHIFLLVCNKKVVTANVWYM